MNPVDQAAAPTAAEIARLLTGVHFAYRNELQLHDGIQARLTAAGIPVADRQREVVLGPADRIDFLIDGLGIEVKVAGQYTAVYAQLGRYAASPRVRELLLVTTRRRHTAGVPHIVGGKPLTVVRLRGGLL